MNWKVIRRILLLILVLLNLGLWGYTRYVRLQMYEVPTDRMEKLYDHYETAGYHLPEELPRRQYPMRRLLLAVRDPEPMADGFFSDNYEKSFMPGSRILYTCGSETLTIDRDHSWSSYSQNEPQTRMDLSEDEIQEQARAFAERLMQTENLVQTRRLEGEDGTRIYFYCEKSKDTIVFSNRAAITVSGGAIIRATVTQYTVSGYEEAEQPVYPIDELLYACPRRLGSGEDTELSVLFGYMLSETEDDIMYCNPTIVLVRPDGYGLQIDQYNDTVRELS